MTRIGVVGNPGRWSSEHLNDTAARLAGASELLDPERLSFDAVDGRVYAGEVDCHAFDAIILKKIGAGYRPEYASRLELLRYLQESGVPVYSDPTRILRVIDRLACTVTLAAHDIPMAPTVVTEDLDEAAAAVERFGSVVAKPLYTSKARGMELIEAGPVARSALERFRHAGNPVMYLQQKLELPGQDLGVVFLGGEYVTTYARTGRAGSWNTSVLGGGRYEPYDPPNDIIELARRAQAPFGLTFTCVDVAETTLGPVVWEVSAFGGFRGLQEARQIDAAELYVRFVMECIGQKAHA
ncbi:MAG: GAK system ATP-grasp enzyme [Gemmatimonadota bacterium]